MYKIIKKEEIKPYYVMFLFIIFQKLNKNILGVYK